MQFKHNIKSNEQQRERWILRGNYKNCIINISLLYKAIKTFFITIVIISNNGIVYIVTLYFRFFN